MSLPGEAGLRATELGNRPAGSCMPLGAEESPSDLSPLRRYLWPLVLLRLLLCQSHPQAYVCEARGNGRYPGLGESASCV